MAETKTKTKKGAPGPLEEHGVSPELALDLLREMLLFRRFEEKAEEGYAIGKIGGFCHLHIGQEGVAAGSARALRPEDYVITGYREHTMAIAKGMDPGVVLAELYGRRDGCSAGRGGSMHLFDRSRNFMGGHAIVGGQIPVATGLGWSIKYRDEDRVCVCYMGDAAVNQGSFHESLNMAAVWHLPVIYVVENNAYGMGTAFRRVSLTEMVSKASPYGIPASSVNGQDVLATYAHFRDVVAEVRAGGGPRFVECQTYRFKGHSMSDPVSGTYRSKEEVEQHTREDDPIGILRDRLIHAGHLDRNGMEALDAEVREVIEAAAEFADASPAPDEADLRDHVYAELNEHGRLFFDEGGNG